MDILLQNSRLDGYEVIKRFRRELRSGDIHIIAISRLDSVIDRLRARLAGANKYVTKPFKTQNVVAPVQRYETQQRE